MKFVLSIAFALTASILSAQHDFMPGYVVVQPGDTIKGWIDNIKPSLNFKWCKFRKAPKGEIVIYSAEQIPAFGMYGGSHYQGFDGDSVRSFYEVLIRGKVSILAQDRKFFATEGAGNPVELKRIRKELEIDRTRYIKTEDRYKQTLGPLMSDCPTIEPSIRKAGFTNRGMVQLAKTYNLCTGSQFTDFGKAKPWLKMNYRVFFGVMQSHFKLIREQLYGAASFKNSNSLTGGIGAEVSSPRINDRLKFLVEVAYIGTSFQGYYEKKGTLSVYRYYVFVDAQSVRIPIGVRINFRNEASTPYVKFGANIDVLFNTSGHVYEERENLSGIISFTYPTERFRKTQKGFWISAGLNKKISGRLYSFIELRYDKLNGYFGTGVENHSSGDDLSIMAGLQF